MKVALVDERMTDECRRALTLRGFRVIDMPKSRYLSEPVASHPDMLVMQLGDTIVSTADYIEDCSYVFTDIREASDVKIHATNEVCRAEYPYDAILNCLDFGNILLADGRIYLHGRFGVGEILALFEHRFHHLGRHGRPGALFLRLPAEGAVIEGD